MKRILRLLIVAVVVLSVGCPPQGGQEPSESATGADVPTEFSPAWYEETRARLRELNARYQYHREQLEAKINLKKWDQITALWPEEDVRARASGHKVVLLRRRPEDLAWVLEVGDKVMGHEPIHWLTVRTIILVLGVSEPSEGAVDFAKKVVAAKFPQEVSEAQWDATRGAMSILARQAGDEAWKQLVACTTAEFWQQAEPFRHKGPNDRDPPTMEETIRRLRKSTISSVSHGPVTPATATLESLLARYADEPDIVETIQFYIDYIAGEGGGCGERPVIFVEGP